MQDRVYGRKITSVDGTQAAHLWRMDKIDQQLIDSAIKQWHKHLAACFSARGGHMEHMLYSRSPNWSTVYGSSS